MSELIILNRNRLPCILLFLCIPWVMMESFLFVGVYGSELSVYLVFFQVVKYFLLLFPPLFWLVVKGIDWDWFRFLLIFFILVAGYVGVSIFRGIGWGEIILSIKNVYFWVFYFLLICSSRVCFGLTVLRCFLLAVAVFSIFNVLYSIFVDLSFERVGDFYFFDFYKMKGIFNDWDFIRDGNVRAFGFMGSPLTLSQTLVVALCSGLVGAGAAMRGGAYKDFALFFVFFLVIVLGVYLTRTRNPLVGCFCSFLFFFCGVFLGFSKKLIFLFFCLIYSAVIFFVFEMGRRGMGDLSSQARVPMLLEFFGLIIYNPLGFGVGSTGVALPTYKYFFESSAATVFMDLGFFGGWVFWGVFFKALYSLWVGIVRRGRGEWMQASVFVSLAALLFMTNFSNIFDSSLLVYSILVAVGVKTASSNSGLYYS